MKMHKTFSWRKWNDFILEKNDVLEASDYKFVLTLPKHIYGGMRAVFNSKTAAQRYMEDEIGSEAWKHVKIKKERVK
ncbi:hypothetical protein HN615_14355 [Candidatus Woesearchaeota archaeon]|jgi:hypothetical protein|nr:hypothetical protein [Candidatus Woesearchaeota archaeon]